MAADIFTFALIGKGKWGQNYIDTISKSNDKWRLPLKNIKTTDYADLFDKKIDGVIIATPTRTHFQIASDFLKKGFNILIEKPITRTYQEAIKLQKIALLHPTQTIMVGHLQLYNPGYLLLKSLLPKIGSITSLEYYGLKSTPRTDTTIIEDWGPHPTYLFMDLLKEEPRLIETAKKNTDQIKLTYFFKNISGNAYITWKSKIKKRLLIVKGRTGEIILDDVAKTVAVIKNSVSRIFPFDQQLSPLETEITEFVSATQTGRKPKSDIQQAVLVMEALDMANQSLRH